MLFRSYNNGLTNKTEVPLFVLVKKVAEGSPPSHSTGEVDSRSLSYLWGSSGFSLTEKADMY